MKILICCGEVLAFSIFSTSAAASEWLSLGKNNGIEVLIDLESEEWSGPVVTYWAQFKRQGPSDKLDFAKDRKSMDCSKRTQRILYSVEYYREGSSNSFEGSDSWSPVVPDTVADAERLVLCSALSN